MKSSGGSKFRQWDVYQAAEKTGLKVVASKNRLVVLDPAGHRMVAYMNRGRNNRLFINHITTRRSARVLLKFLRWIS